MDYLNNISRTDYPVAAETLKVLQDHQRFIECYLDAFTVDRPLLVFVNVKRGELALSEFIAYIRTTPSGRGRMCKVETLPGLVTPSQLINGGVNATVTITEIPQDITEDLNGDITTWEDCYRTVKAKVSVSKSNTYKFLFLTDLIEESNWVDKKNSLIQAVGNATVESLLGASVVITSSNTSIFSINENRLKVRLDLIASMVAGDAIARIIIPVNIWEVGADQIIPLPAICVSEQLDASKTLNAYIKNRKIYIDGIDDFGQDGAANRTLKISINTIVNR